MTLKLQDAIENVRETLELAPPDAAVYVHLCVGGPAKVSELADALHLHRNDVYRSTERLSTRGLVEATLERPARYAAVDPDRVFTQEIENRLQSVQALKESRQKVMDILVQLHATTEGQTKSTYKIIQGRGEIYAARNRLIEEARHDMLWLTTFPGAVGLLEISGGLERMQERVDAGVSLRGLIRTTEESVPRLAPLRARPNAEVRHFDAETILRMLIVDGRTLLMYVVNGSPDSFYANDEVAIQTTAPGFIHAEQLFFEHCWTSGAHLPP